MSIKFIAKSQEGEPNLYKVTVTKETEKTITIENPVKILGWIYLPNRISKVSYRIFDTELDAVSWLIGKSSEYISDLQMKLERARVTHSYLYKLSYEIETRETADG